MMRTDPMIKHGHVYNKIFARVFLLLGCLMISMLIAAIPVKAQETADQSTVAVTSTELSEDDTTSYFFIMVVLGGMLALVIVIVVVVAATSVVYTANPVVFKQEDQD